MDEIKLGGSHGWNLERGSYVLNRKFIIGLGSKWEVSCQICWVSLWAQALIVCMCSSCNFVTNNSLFPTQTFLYFICITST